MKSEVVEKKIEASDYTGKSMPKILIKDVQIKESMYPRTTTYIDKIREYAQNIEMLPPITINTNKILIDGYHRLHAHKERGLTEIEYEVEDIPDEKVLLRSIELNAKHGIQLTNRDKKKLALQLFDGTNGKNLTQILSVPSSTFNGWVQDIRVNKKQQIEARVIHQYLDTENTIESISKDMDMAKSTVGDIINKFPDILNSVFSDKAKPDIKERYRRFLEFRPFRGNVWDIAKLVSKTSWELDINNNYFDLDFGVIPMEVFENILYYYTKPFDTVSIPGGETELIRSCQKWYRRYTTKLTKADLVYVGYAESKEFLNHLKDCKANTKEYLVMLHPNNPDFYNSNILFDLAMENIEKIMLSYPVKMYNDLQVGQASVDKRMLKLYQILSVFKK